MHYKHIIHLDTLTYHYHIIHTILHKPVHIHTYIIYIYHIHIYIPIQQSHNNILHTSCISLPITYHSILYLISYICTSIYTYIHISISLYQTISHPINHLSTSYYLINLIHNQSNLSIDLIISIKPIYKIRILQYNQ